MKTRQLKLTGKKLNLGTYQAMNGQKVVKVIRKVLDNWR